MKRLVWPVIGYVVVTALVYGPALFPGPGEMIWGDDIHRQYYFYRQFFNSFVKEGIWPWWNPYLFSGTPFIANAVVSIWYPPTWLFVFLPINIAYSWHLALHILWAMVGMRLLTRSWIAGLIFGLSGFFSARIWAGHVDVIAAASWMPWVVWTFLRHGVILSGSVFAMQLLAGYQTMAFFTMIAVGIVSIKRLGRVAVAALLGLSLAGIQVIPLQEFFRQSIRTFDFPYSWNSYGSLTIESLKQFFNPFVFGDQLTYSGPPPNFAEHAFFMGRTSILVLALTVFRFRRAWLPFALIALFGLWVSLGPNAPIDVEYLLWKIVPMYQYLRIPPRHLILVVFGLSGLVGLAIQRIKKPYVFVITLIISGEMIFYARHFIAVKPIPQSRHDPELVRMLTQDTEPYRVVANFGVWVPPRDSLDFDAAMQYRIFNATGYDPSILRSYYEYVDVANGNRPGASILTHDVQVPYLNVVSPATDLLNIKYILVPRAYDPLYGVNTDRFVLLREDTSRDYRVYENKTVKPRFFFETGGSVSVEKYSPNEIVLTAQSARDATLVSSEVYYPGWEGFVDGKKIDIQRVNNAFRALFVPAGRHTVVYRYSPRIFLIGGGVSIAAIFVCIMSVIHSRRNSKSV